MSMHREDTSNKKPEQMELDGLIIAGEAWMAKHIEDYKFRASLDELKRDRDILNQTVKVNAPPIPHSAFSPAPRAESCSSKNSVSTAQKLSENPDTSALNNKADANSGLVIAGAVTAAVCIPFLMYLLSDKSRRMKVINFLSALREECKKDARYYVPPPIPE